MRPSPTESATWFMPGTYKKGNDGNIYTISISSSGVHRWIQHHNNNTSLHEIFSPKHPSFGQQMVTSPSLHKFKVGDTVRVIMGGAGCAPEEIGTEVSIVKLGMYGTTGLGYEVYPPIGNSDPKSRAYDFYKGMIGENSFELVDKFQSGINQIIKQHTTTKPVKMAKSTKTITKKTTQEVRQIETSLINKEEVFKMLALAEATGLPLLLVGEPGVNSN